jgi:hypothetical protein
LELLRFSACASKTALKAMAHPVDLPILVPVRFFPATSTECKIAFRKGSFKRGRDTRFTPLSIVNTALAMSIELSQIGALTHPGTMLSILLRQS